ncbi:MAG: GH3 auxin-responsive promoter family protein [Clostridia bacterium]|nr:GH3 auxin-responsive promoter family protein [Clostridia bacterium]
MIQAKMRPYAERLTPPPENKFFTKEEGLLVYEFVRKNILEEKTAENFKHHDYFDGTENLLRILCENRESDFGKFYHFSDITSIHAYQRTVPLYSHESYDKLVHIQTDVGEKNVLTTNSIRVYAYDFDESDAIKTIPVSEQECIELGSCLTNVIANQVTFLMMESLPRAQLLNDRTYNDSISGIMICSALGKYAMVAANVPGEFTSPFSVIFPKKGIDTGYLNLLFALRNPDITQIVAANSWVVLNCFERMFAQLEEFCGCIESGRIDAADEATLNLARQLTGLWVPDKERADFIRWAMKTLPKEQAIRVIWPKLKRIVARGGGRYALYSDQLKPCIGDIPVVSGNLITPFGLLAEETGEQHVYKLRLDKAFYEFIPMSLGDAAAPVLFSDLKCGQIYELVITNHAGAYRMRSNLYIQPVRKEPEELWFVECAKPVCDGAGLLCTDAEIYHVLKEIIGCALYDYSYHYQAEDKKLTIYAETDMDEAQGQACCDRIAGHFTSIDGIDKCQLYFVEKETRRRLRDLRRSRYAISGDCIEPVRNLNDQAIINSMNAWNQMR